jgi:hypothetical protein
MIGWNSWKASGNLTATPEEAPENNCSFSHWRTIAHCRQTSDSSASFAHPADLPLLPATGIAIVAAAMKATYARFQLSAN